MTFIVINKQDGRHYVVYSVHNDSNGYPHFLTYDDEQWRWLSAKHFEPVVGE